jgi:DnaJ like chaperone protein
MDSMSIWQRIAGAFHEVGDNVSSYFGNATPPEKSVAFTIGMIALGAKMAKADGAVTKDEVAAFGQVFQVPDKDRPAVERVFNLAKQDVAGFESYARQVAALFEPGSDMLENVIDGLFHIAKADGAVHEDEIEFLSHIAGVFGFDQKAFRRMTARHVLIADDPFEILGVERDMPFDDIKKIHRKLVREFHPDKHVASGMPQELVLITTERLARINEAFDRIKKEQAQ